jgi:hypothetical protein
MENFEQEIVNKFKCLYCQELCKWIKRGVPLSAVECQRHPTAIEYGFKTELTNLIDPSFAPYKLEFFAFCSKLSHDNFRAVFIVKNKTFRLLQQTGNEMVMKKVLEFDFLPELFPDTVSDKIKNYLVFS